MPHSVLIPAAISGITSIIGSVASAKSQQAANIQSLQNQLIAQAFTAQQSGISREFNAAEALKGRDFTQSMFDQQTELSNTAYKRATVDMRSAGLNPLMMFGGSASANVPSGGGSPTASSSGGGSSGAQAGATKYDLSRLVSEGIATGLQVKKVNKEVDAIDQQISLSKELGKTEKTKQKKNLYDSGILGKIESGIHVIEDVNAKHKKKAASAWEWAKKKHKKWFPHFKDPKRTIPKKKKEEEDE